jgi:hypothetical protein
VQEHGKKFRIKLTNSGDSIDLNKLQLKITLSEGESTIKPPGGGGPVTELSGSVVKLDQAYCMELTTGSTQVIIKLQLWYDNKKLENAESTCTLTWEKEKNTETQTFLGKLTTSGDGDPIGAAIGILQSSTRDKIQTRWQTNGKNEILSLLNNVLDQGMAPSWSYNTMKKYETLFEEIFQLPGIYEDDIDIVGSDPSKTPLAKAIELTNFIYEKWLKPSASADRNF